MALLTPIRQLPLLLLFLFHVITLVTAQFSLLEWIGLGGGEDVATLGGQDTAQQASGAAGQRVHSFAAPKTFSQAPPSNTAPPAMPRPGFPPSSTPRPPSSQQPSQPGNGNGFTNNQPPGAVPSSSKSPSRVPAVTTASVGRYIVKLKPSIASDRVNGVVKTFIAKATGLSSRELDNPDQVVRKMGSKPPALNNAVRYTYQPDVFNGVALSATDGFMSSFTSEYAKHIEYIEPDLAVHEFAATQKSPPNWGAQRISSLELDYKKPYYFQESAGAGVDIYMIDTGIDVTHPDFGGRAKMVGNFIAEEDAADLRGHGTHTAAIAGGIQFGIAKRANIYGIKVLDANGDGYMSGIIAAVQQATKNGRAFKTVINMSLGGERSQSLDEAVLAAYAKGIPVIVAAGNESTDACGTSPAGSKGALTVGSARWDDQVSDFSNYGTCVGIYAPGEDIYSAWIGKSTPTQMAAQRESGTSMAAPHVAGIAALYMSTYTYTSTEKIYHDLINSGNWNRLRGVPAGTPNVLAYNFQDPTQPGRK